MKLLLKNCDILAADGEGFRWLKNAYLGIDGETIDYLGETRPAAVYDSEKDMRHRLLAPGLINCHGHSAMVLLRGVGSDLPLQEWLFDKMIPVEDRMQPEDLRAGMALAQLEMIATGTTSYSDMYMEPRIEAELAAQSGMKVNLCRVMQSFDPNESYAGNQRARESIELFRDCHGMAGDRVRVDFAIHAEYTCFPHIIESYSADCRRLGARMQLHLSETKREHDECVAKYGKTPARLFYDLGTFDNPTSAAHCVWVTDEDLELMREKGVSAIHNPTSNMKLGSGYAPIPKMLEMGINVTLGTDGAASNNNLNMMEEMHLAAVLHNGYHHDPVIMKPAEVLRMATANGAKLQGRPDTGSLAVGKKADIIAFDLDRPHLFPCLDPAALLTYAAQGSDVVMTMVNGRILYENGEYLTLDAERVMADAAAAVKRLYN